MSKEKSTTNVSSVPKAAEGRRRTNTQQMQNVLLLWLDSDIDETNDDCQNTITKLRHIVNYIKTYTNGDQYLEFIQTIVDKKVCMIISGLLGQHIVPRVHSMSQVDSIFILCDNQTRYEQWTKDWSKIKGVFTNVTPICEALKEAVHQCEQNAIPMSFVGEKKKLDQLDPSFMYTQIIKEIILTIEFEENHIQDYIDYCCDAYKGDTKEIENIKKLEREYHNKTPSYWYTSQVFLYPKLNCALRLMDGDIITRMGFFIRDLHRHIEELHQEQYAGTTTANTFTVYRGQGLSTGDFEQMMKNKGGLISFNNFLSTSKDREVSYFFAESNSTNSDLFGILFVMKVDPSQSTTPFASIAGISNFQGEDEVLFSMHSVFRIQDITQISGNNRLYEVNLILTADNDPELTRLTDYIRQESYPNSEGWYRLGSVLFDMGQLDKAEDIYQVLLGQAKDDKNKALIYHHLGWIKDNQEKYQEALTLYEKSLAICQKTLPPNLRSLASSYNNIGNVLANMDNYPEALSSHEKAFEIRQQSLPSIHPDLASSYNNIGNVHAKMGNYRKALSYFEKDLEIIKQSLLPNHPDLAMSYSNIGLVHQYMDNNPEALSSHEKALEIRQQSLPSTHPDLAISYNSIALVHDSMGNHPEALPYYEKALEIQQQLLPSKRRDLAKLYNNIGLVHERMESYPKALSYYEKALEIRQQSLLSNHPDLAVSYLLIGSVHTTMDNYPEALSSHEKALEIQQQSVPPNHADLAVFYNSIGEVHDRMENYPKALLYYEKALEIRRQSLPPNDPDLAKSYNNIGLVYDSMGNYPKALSYYEKALEIRQQSLPPTHPDLAISYNIIGLVHDSMGNYRKAFSYCEKAFEIDQQALPPNHLDMAFSYYNIALAYGNVGNYSKARICYEHAIRIGEQSLPSNHPHLQMFRDYLKDIQNK
ncbi:unnamed protein product [Adineta steineri]|uniref:ADP ribosyltransferase domain-containing protein n=1 Tax=Adineta steineri TaxID=433720 RepID=A0A814AHK3_9BILA|nr:unnamed protein product [Adineta steineri]CAF0967049.1 unnamed protein product [Adineta steineri]CAF4136671.1 unnamed protein product [Adineta steineri]CAF4138927.1 unnamed protein product [Adineta steineri]